MGTTVTQRRSSLFALFFLPGLGFASWVARTPAIRDALGASTAQMGLILMGLSLGSILGVLAVPPLVKKVGTRPLALFGIVGVIASMPAIGLGTALSVTPLVVLGLFLFGVGMGSAEIAMNVDGGVIERETGKTVMAPLHGCFSLGSLTGAVLGFGFNAIDLAVVWHLGIIGAVAAVVLIVASRHVPAGTGIARPRAADTSKQGRAAVWSDPVLLLIGIIALSMALAEGTANEWLPLILVDGHGFSAELGSMFYAIFAATMAIGRFSGGLLVTRFGRTPVFVVSVTAAAAGMAVVSLIDNPIAAVPAVILWGLGISLGFPLALSSAADSGDGPSARVSAVATIGYIALLAGPPTLGFLGEAFGLRTAMLLPLALVMVALSLTRVIRSRDAEPAVGAHH